MMVARKFAWVIAAAGMMILDSCKSNTESDSAGKLQPLEKKIQTAAQGAAEKSKEGKPDAGSLHLPESAKQPMTGEAVTIGLLKYEEIETNDLYPLEGTAGVPEGGRPGSDPEAVRDDNLLTSWKCMYAGEKTPCALSVAFPEPASVRLIRIFPAAGPKEKNHMQHARVKTLRIYTDSGWIDATLEDGWNYRHILFPSDVSTKSLILEIKEVYAGDEDSEIHVADLEIYGKSGKRRGPLEIDPRTAIVSFDWVRWAKGSEDASLIRSAPHWIEFVNGEGEKQRIVKGTCIVGQPGSRYFLVEQTQRAHCPGKYQHYSGIYSLLDAENRLIFDVGPLGGVMGTIFSHPEGIGFATTSKSAEDLPVLAAVISEQGKLKRLENDKIDYSAAAEAAGQWGFTSKGKLCGKGGDDKQESKICSSIQQKEALSAVGNLGGKEWKEVLDSIESGVLGNWYECKTAGEFRVILFSTPLNEEIPNFIAVLGKDGTIKDSRYGQLIQHMVLPGGQLLVEVDGKNGVSADIFGIDPEGKISRLYPSSAFCLPIPPKCRGYIGDFLH